MRQLSVPPLLVALTASLLLSSPSATATGPSTQPSTRPTAPQALESAVRRGADPRLRRGFYTHTESQAWVAGQRDPRFAEVGKTPMALWMSEGWMPLASVERQTRDYTRAAESTGRTPVMAVYAIPGRDCGGYSAGGFGPAEYRSWIKKMAAGLKGSRPMVVLEPDALGLLGACAGQGDRTGLLRFATKKLTKAGAWVYLDAAHTGWVEPAVMAQRLLRSGVRQARGFSVNVASFVRTDVEKRYARRVAKALARRGVRDAHYVMDTSRNGGGQTNGNTWCNPLDARLGRPPQVVGGKRLDAYLWVKAPGESDGTCNGGPPAGQWWPEYVLRLMGRL